MSHTKGPWSWDVEDLTGQCRLVPGILLTDGTDGTPYGDEIDRANARLIAAAPDLLEALKMAQMWLDWDGRYDMQGINAAIRKATGVE